MPQQEPEPADQAAEITAEGGNNGADGVALAMPELVAADAMLGFEVADDRPDGGAPSQLALDLRRHPPFLS
ncbi:hypothetical protein ABIC08_009380 [Bradyrhizobium sp. RT9b]